MTFSRAGDASQQAIDRAQALSHPSKRANPTPFRSILFDEYEPGADIERREVPEFFTDLNLDQIVASITAGRDEYNLKPFFHTPLSHVETINYRHDILRDLENQAVFGHIQSFAEDMRTVRGHLDQAQKLHYKRQKQSWFLDAVEIYCKAVRRLTSNLAIADVRSRGFVAFRQFLKDYTESADFTSLAADTEKLKSRPFRHQIFAADPGQKDQGRQV